MKIKLLILSLFTFFSFGVIAQNSLGKYKSETIKSGIIVKDDQKGNCIISEDQAFLNGDYNTLRSKLDCKLLLQENLVKKNGEIYELTLLSLSMGSSLWHKLSELSLKDYYRLTFKFPNLELPLKHKLLKIAETNQIKDSFVFSYIDYCGNSSNKNKNLPPYTPNHEGKTKDYIVLGNGYFIYDINVVVTKDEKDDNFIIILDGELAGPENYSINEIINTKLKDQCNGLKPKFKFIDFHIVAPLKNGKGEVDLPMFGKLEISVQKMTSPDIR